MLSRLVEREIVVIYYDKSRRSPLDKLGVNRPQVTGHPSTSLGQAGFRSQNSPWAIIDSNKIAIDLDMRLVTCD
jgi:hypothetical protein